MFVLLLCLVVPAEATNVVLIMADDMGWGDPGYNGGKPLTPELDTMAVANSTIVLERFYAENVCSPTRASVMTGRVPDRLCIWTANTNGMPTDEFTVGDAATKSGRVAGHFGKWHLGAFSERVKNHHMSPQGQNVSGPLQHGYSQMFSAQPPAWAHINPNCGCCANRTSGCLDSPVRPASAPTITPSTTCVNKNQLVEGNALKGFNEECDTYYFADATAPGGVRAHTDLLDEDDSKVIGDAVVNFIHDVITVEKKNFLATVWFHTPHQNFAASDKWLSLYDTPAFKDSTAIDKLYYADISGMDYQIGRIRAALRDVGAAEDTLVFFTADNGPEHNTPGSTGGLTGRKRDLTEGGVRNPGLLEWPRKITRNIRSNYPAKVFDYLPTVLALFNVESSHPSWSIDGINLVPAVEQIVAHAEQQHAAATSANSKTGDERGGERERGTTATKVMAPAPVRPSATPLRWETQHAFGGAVNAAAGHVSMQLAIVDNDLKLYGNRSSVHAPFVWKLFNVTSDPTETVDIQASQPEVVAALNTSLHEWIEDVAMSRTAAENGCNRWDPMANTPST